MPQAPVTTPIGSPFIEIQSVDSTNNYARKQIGPVSQPGNQDEPPYGAAFFAHEQTAGRGQRERSWVSEKGANIAMSIVMDPRPLLISRQFHLNACVAVSVQEFFIKYAGETTSIKWPNDIYWQDRKAGGILIESGVRSLESGVKKWDWAIVGIGININQTDFPDWLPNPVSLKQITGKDLDPVTLAKELCSCLDKNYRQLIAEGFQDIFTTYNATLYKRDQQQRFKKENRVFEAIIKGVSPDGKLIVSHGIEEEFDFGEIEWS